MIPLRGQRSPPVDRLTNFAFFSSIFHAIFAGSGGAPLSVSASKIATTIAFVSFPFISPVPMKSGDFFECAGTLRTSRTVDLSWRNINSDPQISHEIQDNRSEISVAPRSFRPRSSCRFSRSTTLSLDIFLPMSAFATSSAPHRIALNPSEPAKAEWKKKSELKMQMFLFTGSKPRCVNRSSGQFRMRKVHDFNYLTVTND